MAGVGGQMAASYTVSIDGIQRTKREIARLDGAIAQLRQAQYTPSSSVTVASSLGGGSDLLVHRIDALEGRVQSATQRIMASAMANARRLQTQALRAATTRTGASGKSHVGGRNGPGRDDSGAMIAGIGTNVETLKMGDSTHVTGWHGWGTEARGADKPTFTYQEKGTKGHSRLKQVRRKAVTAYNRASNGGKKSVGANNGGVPAANSLGQTIPTIREELKRELDTLR